MSSAPMHQRKAASRGSSNISSNGSDMYGRGYGDIEGGGVRGRGGGGLSSGDANAGILEQQNNERINELSEHVARLKGLTLEIGNEVR
jgi:blocked early in transport 1